MFLVDTEQGRIIDDEEIKRTIATQRPYASGSTSTSCTSTTFRRARGPAPDPDTLLQRQVAFATPSRTSAWC